MNERVVFTSLETMSYCGRSNACETGCILMRKSVRFGYLLGFRMVLFGCLFLVGTSRLAAQGGAAQLGGGFFTPTLGKVTQDGTSDLLLTFRTEATYDSNVLSTQFTELSTGYSLVEGQAQYSLQRESDTFLLTCVGGGRFYPLYPNLNTSIQDARLQWQHHFTKRSTFTMTARWASLPQGIVESGNGNQLSTLLGTPELSASFLQQRIEIAEGTVAYQYNLSPHSSVIVGGNYHSTQRYGVGLIDSKEQDAYAGIYFQATRRQSLGIMYAHQWLYYSGGLESSFVDNLLLSYSIQLTNSISFSPFGGPALVSIQPGPASTSTNPSQVGVALKEQGLVGGAKLEVGFGHNKVRAEYSRLVTGGSGFLATVLRQTSDVNYSRAFSRHLELNIEGIYTSNRQLGATTSSFTTYYAEPAMHYNMTPHLRISVSASTGKVQGLTQFGSLTRNQLTTQIEYRFQQIPLER
jgi:hypothetical protein